MCTSMPFLGFYRNPFALVIVLHRNSSVRALARLIIADFAKTEKEKPQHLTDVKTTRTSLLESEPMMKAPNFIKSSIY